MTPIRVLLVDDNQPVLRGVQEELRSVGGFELFTAGSAAAGMLLLAGRLPDLLIVQPQAGRGTADAWRRAVERHRRRRPLGVAVLAKRLASPDLGDLREFADVAILAHPPRPGEIRDLLLGLAEPDGPFLRAA